MISNFLKNYQAFETRMQKLEQENYLLKLDNQNLNSAIQNLQIENQALNSTVKNLQLENNQLKEKLGLNSKNSSIPSSKELYKIQKANRKKSNRNIGAQPGHKGIVKTKMQADEVIAVNLPTFCECGGTMCLSKKPYIHQKVDIPEIKPYVVEYQLEHGRCNKCGKRKTSALPAGVTRDSFGPRVKSIIAALTGFYKNSKRETASIIRDIFNFKISVGSISNNENRVSTKCKSQYEDVELEVSNSEILHIDETSHYQGGKRGWCWVFTSNLGTLIKLTDSRGKKVLEQSVFGTSSNVVVTDRYAAYNYFAAENRQACWSHLSRDFARFEHSSYQEVKVLGYNLGQVAREVFDLKRALLKKEIDVLRFIRRSRKLRKRTWYYLKEVAHIGVSPHASRVAKNIMKYEDMMWKFLDDPYNIPLTNNHAERQIRHYVVYRKNSYFTQSERGNRFLERIISLYLSWKQKNKNPIVQLQNILLAT